jgi:CBS-domain-containing membrane protein
MRLIDGKIKKNLTNYIGQSFLATFAIFLVLAFLNVLKETAIIASLGATAFIIFTMPKSYFSKPRCLIGGYVVGIIAGLFCHFICCFLSLHLILGQKLYYILFGSLAVGIAIFLMVITNTEHAPAAGIALGLVINEWDWQTIIFIISAVILFAVIKRLLKAKLIDLV